MNIVRNEGIKNQVIGYFGKILRSMEMKVKWILLEFRELTLLHSEWQNSGHSECKSVNLFWTKSVDAWIFVSVHVL